MDSSTSPKCTGCGNTFPLLEKGAVMCAKCLKLEALSMDSAEYKEIMSRWLQCEMCSESFRNMQKTANFAVQVCGSSMCSNIASNHARVSVTPLNVASPAALALLGGFSAVPETHAARAAATRERLKLAVATAATNSVVAGTSLTTSILARQEQAPSSQHVIVCFKFRRGAVKSLDINLGGGRHRFLRSDYISDIKEHCLKSANAEWIKSGTSPLRINEVSLRFSGNRNFDNGTNSLSIGEFVEYYSGTDKVGLCLEPSSADVKDIKNHAKLTVLTLELYIHTDIYDSRVVIAEEDEYEEAQSTKKRRRHRTNLSSEGFTSKYSKSSSGNHNVSKTIGSSFCPSSQTEHMTINKTTIVTFKKIICKLDPSTGIPSFSELDEVIGYLQNSPFATGTMKCAFELILRDGDDNNVYAAKRFFRLEDGTDNSDISTLISTPVDANEHNIQIQAECTRALQGNWFLSAFKRHCQELAVTIDESVTFADVFLIQEIGTPSPASGLKSDSTGPGMMWLVERRRSTHVQRFSGTLSHRSDRRDLCASTVYALAHFIYGHSKKGIVFADIQGTLAQVKGQDALVLFDPMSHTKNGDSGIGDFGPAGIASFVRDHGCGNLCRRLRLTKEIPLNVEDEDEDENNDTDKEA